MITNSRDAVNKSKVELRDHTQVKKLEQFKIIRTNNFWK